MKTTKTNHRARHDAYIEKGRQEATTDFLVAVTRIRDTLEQLQNEVEDHFGFDPDHLHFGHVGDANRILANLIETLAIARNEQK